ncbi:hypothetical protein KIL84_000138 [Mauremys mutica]|uniref:Uncharacterized protein n=1 Tax=Mauremys mutica TaxID=74926 RepID=A0A9D3XF97_9SAUR|nr:hypothetical protein KIL84_000138 [Mauremys mutica]
MGQGSIEGGQLAAETAPPKAVLGLAAQGLQRKGWCFQKSLTAATELPPLSSASLDTAVIPHPNPLPCCFPGTGSLSLLPLQCCQALTYRLCWPPATEKTSKSGKADNPSQEQKSGWPESSS